jgi:hypothetical protein
VVIQLAAAVGRCGSPGGMGAQREDLSDDVEVSSQYCWQT